jgi:hypothetical protein
MSIDPKQTQIVVDQLQTAVTKALTNKNVHYTCLSSLAACAGIGLMYNGLQQAIDGSSSQKPNNKDIYAHKRGIAKTIAGLLAFSGGIYGIYRFGA